MKRPHKLCQQRTLETHPPKEGEVIDFPRETSVVEDIREGMYRLSPEQAAQRTAVLDRAALTHAGSMFKLEPVRDNAGVYTLAMRPSRLVSGVLGANDWKTLATGTLRELLAFLETKERK